MWAMQSNNISILNVMPTIRTNTHTPNAQCVQPPSWPLPGDQRLNHNSYGYYLGPHPPTDIICVNRSSCLVRDGYSPRRRPSPPCRSFSSISPTIGLHTLSQRKTSPSETSASNSLFRQTHLHWTSRRQHTIYDSLTMIGPTYSWPNPPFHFLPALSPASIRQASL